MKLVLIKCICSFLISINVYSITCKRAHTLQGYYERAMKDSNKDFAIAVVEIQGQEWVKVADNLVGQKKHKLDQLGRGKQALMTKIKVLETLHGDTKKVEYYDGDLTRTKSKKAIIYSRKINHHGKIAFDRSSHCGTSTLSLVDGLYQGHIKYSPEKPRIQKMTLEEIKSFLKSLNS